MEVLYSLKSCPRKVEAEPPTPSTVQPKVNASYVSGANMGCLLQRQPTGQPESKGRAMMGKDTPEPG